MVREKQRDRKKFRCQYNAKAVTTERNAFRISFTALKLYCMFECSKVYRQKITDFTIFTHTYFTHALRRKLLTLLMTSYFIPYEKYIYSTYKGLYINICNGYSCPNS